jgi:cellulose synthase/poly-beta-1,6-N-acetylglucosamine synthase-like glycosyltransferase
LTTEFLFWIALLHLVYIYVGYWVVLRVFAAVRRTRRVRRRGEVYAPSVSIVIPAHNEERSIGNRIRNILQTNYPVQKKEIIIASDGSTDSTVHIANEYESVKVLAFSKKRGRAPVHNDAIAEASGDIIVFSDAETTFDQDFLWEIVSPFRDPTVGVVVGNLSYQTQKTSMSQGEGLYWRIEKQIRKQESRLGILSTGTGACMAVRKRLWNNLDPVEDVDCVTPLQLVLQGYRVVFASGALAYDEPPSSIKEEFKARIRMTSKDVFGTLKTWGWRGWMSHPLVSWGILSHKLLRWMTPYFMVVLLGTNLLLAGQSPFYQAFLAAQAIFYCACLSGWVLELFGNSVKPASTCFAFAVASLGMGTGFLKGILGKAPAAY